MTHRFPIKEIARQAGMSTATVDRVLHQRAHVSPQTRLRVEAALKELAHQESQLAARGRRLFVDIVVEAPTRFSHQVQWATEQVLPHIGAAVFRPRFIFQELMDETALIQILTRIAKRGSHGVCLKARDVPRVREMIDKLVAQHIPVVTLVTDIQNSERLCYAGLNNANAGRTAAYLIAKTLKDQTGTILTTKSQDEFSGEEKRDAAFREVIQQQCPNLEIVDVSGGAGVGFFTAKKLASEVENIGDLKAVYSIGGGNLAIHEMLHIHGYQPDIFVGHDLDEENRQLLKIGVLDFVLHHDLQSDMRGALLAISAYHKLTNHEIRSRPSDVVVVTPHNMPVLST